MTTLDEVRAAYERGEGSLRDLAAQFGVAERTLFRRASKEKWQQPAIQGGSGRGDCGSSDPEGAATFGSNGGDCGSSDPEGAATFGSGGSNCGSSDPEGAATFGSSGDESTGARGLTIPAPFPDSLDAAIDVYVGLGLPVYPCNRPNEGRGNERGKKPCFTGWKHWKCSDLTDAIRREYFECEDTSNIGCFINAPRIVVDLDSKPDQGRSVMEWLKGQPALSAVPRERTAGGVHLWFTCPDLPEFYNKRGHPYEKNLVSEISEKVIAELVFCSNVILSPSRHPEGVSYRWEVGGEVPEISWAQLQEQFGFEAPDAPKAKKGKEKPWWSAYSGDVRTLDIVELAEELGLHGELLDADKRTHSVRCPWAEEHSDAGREWSSRGSDTVVFEGSGDQMPGFHCLHAHCQERDLKEFLAWAESRVKGIVDKNCEVQRVWSKGQRSADGVRPRILLPGIGRPDSVFATEGGQLIGRKHAWFSFADNPVVIRESVEKTAASAGLRIHMLKPVEAITEVERHVEVGVLRKDEAGDSVFIPLSMSEASARVFLAAPQLRESLPPLRRVLDVSLPVLMNGSLLYPNPGYDPRFGTFLAADAPDVAYMNIEEARALILDDLLGDKDSGGFCWTDDQSKCHAVARVITPFCRGLMGWARAPLWIVEANRERCGKDYFAQLPCIMFLGRKVIFAPPTKDSDEEMRKRITTALMANARMVHFANIKGHVRYAALEAATDNTGVWQDRILGGNSEACLPNEAEFSFSANAGTTWEPDIEGRSRRIRLHFDKEEINSRTFRHPDLHEWVMENRPRLLSACGAFVAEWERQGRPCGPTPFSSFPQWARVVGGIMHACGLGDPCLPHSDASKITGDQHTEAMKTLFAIAFEAFGDRDVKKPEMYDLIRQHQDGGLLDWVDLSSRSGQTSVGRMLTKYNGRELGGIRMVMPSAGKNNLIYRFLRAEDDAQSPKEGTWEPEGTFSSASRRDKNGHLPTVIEKEEYLYTASAEVPVCSHVPAVVESRSELGRIAEEIALADSPLALDIETYNESRGGGALSPFTSGAQIRLLTLAVPGREPWIIDLRATGYDLGELGGVIEGGEVVGHNLKFDLLWLLVKCGILARRVFCTMTASRLLTSGGKDPNDLGAVITRHLGIRLPKDQGRSDWGGMLLTPDQLRYSADDARHLHLLRSKLDEAIAAANLGRVAELEMSLLPVVVEMEAAGFPVDRAALAAIAADAHREMVAATGRLRDALGQKDLNPSSPIQLKTAFNKLGVNVEDTTAEVLSEVDHDAARAALAYREHEKAAQQAQSLAKAICADGRIHARFEPVGTITGRFSSKEPNLQQVKRGAMRTAFRAPSGKALVVADYSQVELRAVAAIAGDKVMLDAFGNGEDLHRKTAALVLGKPESEINKHERQTSKAVNFGLIYGQSAAGLVRYARTNYEVVLSLEEATRMRERFFTAYRGIAAWHKQAWRSASEIAGAQDCCSHTALGRRRLMPLGGEDWPRFTTLVNTPVQGTCGDGMKMAMVRIGALLPPGAQMIATIHDELVILVDAGLAEAVKAMVVDEMRAAMAGLLPGVPIEVEAGVCSNWGEK
jgi:DNA polymerase I